MTALEDLPAKVSALETQISQLCDEMRSQFSTIRGKIRAGDEETRRVLGQQIEESGQRASIVARTLHEALVEQIKGMGEGPAERLAAKRARAAKG